MDENNSQFFARFRMGMSDVSCHIWCLSKFRNLYGLLFFVKSLSEKFFNKINYDLVILIFSKNSGVVSTYNCVYGCFCYSCAATALLHAASPHKNTKRIQKNTQNQDKRCTLIQYETLTELKVLWQPSAVHFTLGLSPWCDSICFFKYEAFFN